MPLLCTLMLLFSIIRPFALENKLFYQKSKTAASIQERKKCRPNGQKANSELIFDIAELCQ